ncbi:MAG TPA: hypothetical protein VNF47_08310, partial [Streptosporangiaceae bacterium]|nr:hypothetical protein [Streptosporangiaceae bacterium]
TLTVGCHMPFHRPLRTNSTSAFSRSSVVGQCLCRRHRCTGCQQEVTALAGCGGISLVYARPTVPDAAAIATELSRIRANLGAAGQPVASGTTASDPASALSAMISILDGDLKALAAASGACLLEDVIAELMDRYRAWLGFLLASRDQPAGPPGGQMTARIAIADGDTIPPALMAPGLAVTRLPLAAAERAGAAALADGLLVGQPS